MAVNQPSPRVTARGRGLFTLPKIPDNCTITTIYPSRLWNNAWFVSTATYLIGPQHSLDLKVGYLLATYILHLSLRNDCCI